MANPFDVRAGLTARAKVKFRAAPALKENVVGDGEGQAVQEWAALALLAPTLTLPRFAEEGIKPE